jgi:hypothetical protein
MFWILSVTVTLLWVLGTATAVTFGGALHVLFAITMSCVLLRLARGPRAVPAVVRLRKEERVTRRTNPR